MMNIAAVLCILLNMSPWMGAIAGPTAFRIPTDITGIGQQHCPTLSDMQIYMDDSSIYDHHPELKFISNPNDLDQSFDTFIDPTVPICGVIPIQQRLKTVSNRIPVPRLVPNPPVKRRIHRITQGIQNQLQIGNLEPIQRLFELISDTSPTASQQGPKSNLPFNMVQGRI